MAEKILNTRIQLKYDKYETWVEQNPTLKSGELAIAYLSTSHTATSPDNGTHAVMFKVGPGAFNSLPWASALAADVYGWAKRSEAEFATNFLAMQDSNGETMQTKLDNLFVTPDELNTALSNLQTNVLTDLSNRVKAIEDDYLKKADKTELEGKITAEETRATGEEERIEGLVTAEASRADTEEKRLAGLITDNAEDIAEIIDAENGILAQAKADATSKADAAKSGAEATAAAALATARTEISAEIDADVKALADGAVKDNTDAITAINNADTGILAQAKAYTDDMKDNLLGEGIKDTFDTLVEIQNWIEGDGVNATELADAIAGEAARAKAAEEKIAKFDENGDLVDGALFDEVNGLQNQIDALGITDGKVQAAAKADVASGLDETGVAQVQGIKVNNATNADKADSLTDNAKAEVKAVKVDNATHADAASKVDNALTITTEDGTEVIYDGSAVKSVDLTGLATKTYVDGLADNYATATQGAKADTAVQSVTTPADQGLKATRTDNDVVIEIDDSVVFVFNCGSATENI